MDGQLPRTMLACAPETSLLGVWKVTVAHIQGVSVVMTSIGTRCKVMVHLECMATTRVWIPNQYHTTGGDRLPTATNIGSLTLADTSANES